MVEGAHKAIAVVFLVSLMFSIGLAVTWREIWEAFRHPGFLAKVLAANLVLVPLAGFALVHVFTLDPDIELGFLFMAAAPGAPFALQFTSKTREQRALAAGLFFVLSALAGIFSAAISRLLIAESVQVSVPFGPFVLQRVLWVLAPLILGLLVRQRSAAIAHRLSRPFVLVSMLAFVTFVVVTQELRSQAMKQVGGDSLLAMALLILFGLAVGWVLGGPRRGVRRVLATGTSMRNVALGLLVAAPAQGRPGIAMAMVAFAALMIPINALFTFGDLGLTKLRARRAARARGEGSR